MDIGKNIRKIRKSRNMTLEQVGNLVGLPKQTIQRYESGAIKNIPYDKLISIANALHCSGADFFVDTVADSYIVDDFYKSETAIEIVKLTHDKDALNIFNKYLSLSAQNKQTVESVIDGLLGSQNK